MLQPQSPQSNHVLGISLAGVALAVALSSTSSSTRNSLPWLSKFYTLSYPKPSADSSTIVYGKGLDDFYLLIGLLLGLTVFQRLFFSLSHPVLETLLKKNSRSSSGTAGKAPTTDPKPLRSRAKGSKSSNRSSDASPKHKEYSSTQSESAISSIESSLDDLSASNTTITAAMAKQRLHDKCRKFADQLYLLMYYSWSMSTGYYIYSTSTYYPLFENSANMWIGYPHHLTSGLIKSYYLAQAAFWLQQLFLYAFFTPREERRKDHWAMTAHHLITSILVTVSYASHFTGVGNVVLIVMDAADLVLGVAKCLKYLGKRFQLACDIMFGLFAVVWLYTRHVVYFFLMYSIAYEGTEILQGEKYLDPWIFRTIKTQDDMDRPSTYFSPGVARVYIGLFSALQVLLLFWFMMIIKVIYRVVSGSGAGDVREDDD